MKITQLENGVKKQPKIGQVEKKWYTGKWAFIFIRVIVLSAVFMAGALLYKNGFLETIGAKARGIVTAEAIPWLKDSVKAAYKNVSDEARLYDNNGLNTLYLNMAFEDYQTILDKRQNALNIGILLSSDTDFVPAEVSLDNGPSLDAKIRLKGDWTDHLEGEKWSFRIKLAEDGQIMHFRQFNIQTPETRSYLNEWAFHELMIQEGVLTTRYNFVNVVLNGKLLGVYAIEEHFTGDLVESQGRRQGVIIRFNEDLLWENRANFLSVSAPIDGSFEVTDEDNATIDAFQASKIAEDPVLSQEAETAMDMLRAFQLGERSAEETFDLSQVGRFYALSDLWGACHGTFWHNMRYFYNPISGLLEPVAYDSEPFTWCDQSLTNVSEFLSTQLFKEPAVREAYARELKRISSPEYISAFQQTITAQETIFNNSLSIEYSGQATDVDWATLNKRATTLNAELDPPTPVKAVYQAVGIGEGTSLSPEIHLDITNLMILPVDVLRLEINGQSVALDRESVRLPMVEDPENQEFTPVRISAPLSAFENLDAENLNVRVIVQLAGLEKEIAVDASGVSVPDGVLVGPLPEQPTAAEVLAKYPFLTNPNQDHRLLMVDEGNWLVEDDLILPDSMDLLVPAGATLSFAPGKILMATGAIILRGNAEEPVVLTAQDPQQGWGGVVVLRSSETSEWTYASVQYTTGMSRDGWVQTGGINFFQSDVNLQHVYIGDNQTEDAINIIHSQFSFVDVEIANTFADAFDSDFSNGEVVDSYFHDIAGDAVDVSGTEATVANTRMERITDKGVSVGEKSNVTIQDVRMENVGIGVASKDLSKTYISDSEITNAHFSALAAYIKKPVYGPAYIEANHMTFISTETISVAQKGSTILVDGVAARGQDLDVDTLYHQKILGN